ncbi:MAG: hypothetical protein JNK99_01160 [Candidatus Accumulibacter sp.]|uniref:hypothetical protein n=1 Tax=Accumulibacter sp. TaxID=2053492 RepID=UPI001A52752F|nr:hypothetical protein [Accumulibacter sp.]MBL8393347.1 hypothetical protein [Accumulibacter sp.]
MLRQRSGVGCWRKKKGIAAIRLADGTTVRAEIDWWCQGATEDKGMAMKFVVCLSREGFGEFSTDDLTLGRLHEVPAQADSRGMLRIVDDSGEGFLYPASFFEPGEVREQTASRPHELLVA